MSKEEGQTPRAHVSVTDFRDAPHGSSVGPTSWPDRGERFRHLFENAPIGIYITTPEGRILDANPALVRMLGYERFEELAERNLETEYETSYLRADFKTQIERDGYVSGLEANWMRKDGDTIAVREHARVVTAPDGSVLAYEGTVEDITDRKRAERELGESRTRYSELFDNASDIVYAANVDGHLTSINLAGERLTGYSRAELLTMKFDDMLAPEFRSDKRPIDGDAPDEVYEIELLTRDGQRLPLEVRSSRVVENGMVVAIHGVARDITDRRRADEATQRALADLEARVEERAALLFESEMRFQSVVESASDAIVLADESGNIASWNRGAEALFGYSESDVIGKPLTMLMPDRYQDSHTSGMERLALTGEPRTIGRVVEMHAVASDGREFPVEVSLGTWSIEGRTFYSGILRDISDRKRSEAESESMRASIERSAREWQRTLDVIAFPILLVDSKAHILRLNRTARDLLHAPTYGEVLGHRLDEIAGAEPWTTATQLVRSMAGEPAGGSRNVSVLASRRAWDVEATIWTRAEDGEARIVLLVRDVTSTVRLQESLRRTETMAAIGGVVASVAHEVRTPLFSIGATVDAFEAEFAKYQGEFAEYQGVLRRQVDRLSKLMEDLLEYGKPLSILQAPEPVDDLVAVAVELCKATAAQRGVQVTGRFSDDLPRAYVDRARSIQVLQNLIENAIQFSSANDTVEIVVSAVGRSDGDWIVCRVLDSGPGFAERDLGRVFEPFFTKRSGGTGLGLSIVQRIVDQHGGVVYAENRPRGGACLTVLLPQEPGREETAWPSIES